MTVVTYEGIEARILTWHLTPHDGKVLAKTGRENTDHNGCGGLITSTLQI